MHAELPLARKLIRLGFIRMANLDTVVRVLLKRVFNPVFFDFVRQIPRDGFLEKQDDLVDPEGF